jgi:hypothetical protein
MTFIYAFISFIFFKVLSVFLFNYQMTITAAALIAIISAALVFLAQLHAARSIDARLMTHPLTGGRNISILRDTALPFIAATVGTIGAGSLIIIGFSERFAERIYGYRSDDWPWLALMLAIPPVLFWGLSVRMLKDVIQNADC